jgi:TetR/AcrR family transcriptional regulator, fatty acid metabolism regulator protein
MKTADKHSKIIRAATKVFAKKGFFNARISDIAKEAKVADGTIYLYFNNKYDMLLSVFEEKIGRLVEQINSQLEKEEDPRRMLELFIANHLREMKKNKNLAEVIQIELRQTNKMIKDYRNNKFNEYLNIISTIIKRGQTRNVFRQDILPGIAKRAIFGAMDEITRIWNINIDSEYKIEEIEDQVIKIFLVGVLEHLEKIDPSR